MKKRLKALFMALVLMLTSVVTLGSKVVETRADSVLSLVFHFTAGTSSQYYMWIWTTDGGIDVAMTESGNEWIVTLDANSEPAIDSGTVDVNYIIKNGEGWGTGVEKDVDADRKIDMSQYVSGQVDVYIESGVSQPTVDDSKAVKDFKITYASASDNFMNIDFTSVKALEDEEIATIKVRDNNNGSYVGINAVNSLGDNKYSISLATKLDYEGSYTIEYRDGRQFLVSLPDYYSTEEFNNQYKYKGDDLGATWSATSTTFKVWAPLATDVKVNLYESGTAGTDDLIKSVSMSQSDNGTWVTTVDGDLNGVYYTYTATVSGIVQKDIVDPYARTTGVNGNRGMVIDLDSTDPEGWENDKNPFTSTNYVDAVLYELHVRDFSCDDSSGMTNKGKYLAFTEKGTTNSYGQSTGIDYLRDLGVTHVHLMPVYDYASVDETGLDETGLDEEELDDEELDDEELDDEESDIDLQYNWGYDPQNFNTPEGSYSTDPYNGEVRVKEFKQMVQSLHEAGIAVVMDVVYGHVNSSSDFSINRLTPSYYSRPNSSASGCGNDTATEREMNRKFIIDSMVYWATEYHVNGFRIDQEGLFDVDTINEAIEALHAIDPAIIVYGEGWDMSYTNTTKDVKLASQSSATDIVGNAFFNDLVRDALKGSVFYNGAGYVTGEFGKLSSILDIIIANPGWQRDPNSVVNYNSCHDNYTLFDRISITKGNENISFEQKVRQNNLAAAIVYTSQGIPFMQAGEEILRSKPTGNGTYSNNSYNLADSINSIKWDTLNDSVYSTTHDYYKGLIEFRKAHEGLRMTSETDIEDNLTFLNKGNKEDGVIAFMINGKANYDDVDDAADEDDGVNDELSEKIVVIYNPSNAVASVDLPEGNWEIYVQGDKAGIDLLGTVSGNVEVEPISAMVLVDEKSDESIILGDGNGDGIADIKDSALLKRYLAGWEVDIDLTAADMDGDGNVTIKDSALLKRQLAGW
jgi:pullulanase